VVPGEAAKGVFTRDVCDRLREQLIAGLRKGKPNFDAALLETVGAIRDEFDRGDVTKPASATGRVTAATRPVRSRAEQIFDALTGDVPELRKAAADVLRASAATDRATAEAAVPRLVEMLRGSDAGARVTAAELLGEIGRGQPELVKPAVGPLVEALRDNTSNDLRRAAARALAGAGPAAREQAAGALKTAAENDADAGVRQEAGAALKAVEGDKQ
jgi:HEAT repeat protein